MSNVFSLDSFREEAEKEFAPVKIGLSDGTEVSLRSLIRLGKKDREKVLSLLDELQKDQESEEDDGLERIDRIAGITSELILLVSDRNGRTLVKEIDGDISLLLKVVETWMEATQPGEAESSPES